MASYVFNIAKGRVVELFRRVDINDPAKGAIVVIPLKVSETEANAQDFDTVKEFLEGTADEQTEGWARKVLTDLDIASLVPDDVNNRFAAPLPEMKWAAPTKGKNLTGLLVAFDPAEGEGTDAELVPLVHLDFEVTADGSDIVFAAGDAFRAT